MKALRITRSCSCPEPELASGVVVIRGAPAAATCRLLLDNLCPPLHLLHLHSCLGVNAAAALRYLLGAAGAARRRRRTLQSDSLCAKKMFDRRPPILKGPACSC
jgi:hypothetical protein